MMFVQKYPRKCKRRGRAAKELWTGLQVQEWANIYGNSNSEAGAKEEEWLAVIPNVIFIKAQDAINAAKCRTHFNFKTVFHTFCGC